MVTIGNHDVLIKKMKNILSVDNDIKISFEITILKLTNFGLLLRATLHKLPLFYLTYWCGNFAKTLSFRRISGNMMESFSFFLKSTLLKRLCTKNEVFH